MANPTNPTPQTWRGKTPSEDTSLAVTDTGGRGTPILYLNGQFTTQFHWRKTIKRLGTTSWRHITYDNRARGRSSRSADYSFAAALRDIDAVLSARGVSQRVLVVGWSYGANLAAHWASGNPERCLGAVLIDGAYPYDWLDDAMEERLRRLFRRLAWVFPLLRPCGLAPRMTGAEMAESNIEIGVLSRESEFAPVLDAIRVPVRYVLASGGSFVDAEDEGLEQCRRTVEAVAARNSNIGVSAKVTSGHSFVLWRNSSVVAEAIREVAVLEEARS